MLKGIIITMTNIITNIITIISRTMTMATRVFGTVSLRTLPPLPITGQLDLLHLDSRLEHLIDAALFLFSKVLLVTKELDEDVIFNLAKTNNVWKIQNVHVNLWM
jgi:hypothetical protein